MFRLIMYLCLVYPSIPATRSKCSGELYINPDADFTLGAIIPVRGFEDYMTCGDLQPTFVIEAEAISYEVKAANGRLKKDGYGFSIGVRIRNSCDSAFIGLQQFLPFVTHAGGICNMTEAAPKNVTSGCIVGMVGPISSVVSQRVCPLLELFGVPLISSSATSPELDNQKMFPTFFRTVPSDVFQTKAILALLRHLNVTLVSIVYEQTTYGQNMNDHFNKIVRELQQSNGSSDSTKFCIDQSIPVSVDNELRNETIKSLVDNCSNQCARAIIVFMDFSIARKFFILTKNYLNSRNISLDHFMWFGSDAWSSTSSVLKKSDNNEDDPQLLKLLNGSITMEPLAVNISDFNNHIFSLTIGEVNDSNNCWLRELLKYNGNTTLLNASHLAFDKLNFKFEGALNRAHFIKEAIYIYESAFRMMWNNSCEIGACGVGINDTSYLDMIRTANFSTKLRKFSFHGGNSGPPTFTIFKISSYDNKSSWTNIGNIKFSSINTILQEPELENYTVFNYAKSPRLDKVISMIKKCRSCPATHDRARYKSDMNRCCFSCTDCPSNIDIANETGQCSACHHYKRPNNNFNHCEKEEPCYASLRKIGGSSCQDRYSDFVRGFLPLSIFAVLGALLTIGTGIAYFLKRDTAVVMLRVPQTLGLMLAAQLVLFLAAFMSLVKPTTSICLIHWSLLALCIGVITTAVAAKAARILYFNAQEFGARAHWFLGSTTQQIQIASATSAQIVIIAVWIVTELYTADSWAPNDVVFTGRTADERQETFLMCYAIQSADTIMLFAFPFGVLFATLFFLLRGHKSKIVHVHLEMTQLKVMCVSWLAAMTVAVPVLVIGADGFYEKVVVELLCFTLMGFLHLSSIHFPNVLIALFRPKLNTLEYMSRREITDSSWQGSGGGVSVFSRPDARGRVRIRPVRAAVDVNQDPQRLRNLLTTQITRC